MSELYDLSVKDIKMNTVDLSSFKGKTLLIVNVAVSYTHLTLPTKA